MKKLLLLLVGAVVALAAHADVTVRFQNSKNWGDVFIWAWTSTQDGGPFMEANGYNNNFGGQPMNYNSESGLYELTFKTAPGNVIFGNKNNTGENTGDKGYTAGRVYNGDGNVIYESNWTRKVYLPGGHNQWDQTTNVSAVEGIATFKNVALGTNGFRVQINDGYNTTNYSNGGGNINNKTWIKLKGNSESMYVSGATSSDKFDVTVDVINNRLYVEKIENTEPVKYTIYFYDKNNLNLSTVKAHYWDNSGNHTTEPGVDMTKLEGKVVKEGNNEYPVWKLEFTQTWAPTGLIINKGNIDDRLTISGANATFVNGGFYTNGSSTGDTSKSVTDKTPETHTYVLHSNLFGNAQDTELVATTNYTITKELSGNETGLFFGIKIDDSWRGASVANAEYNGTTTTYNMTATSGNRVDLKAGLKGTITIKYNPTANTVTVSGGTFQTVAKTYKIYFVNNSSVVLNTINAYIWNSSNNKNAEWTGEAMTKVGGNKGIYFGNEFREVWEYTFTWSHEKAPENVIINGENINVSDVKLGQTNDLTFVNNGFYVYNGSSMSTETGLTITDKKQDNVVTIYMHWKEEFFKNGIADKPTPYCHIYNMASGVIYNTWQSDAQKMYLVSEKYNIWGYDIPEADAARFSDVVFHFYRANGEKIDEYKASTGDGWEAANWTKYIYSVNDGHKAAQTYLTYEDFCKLDAQGRPHLYLVGGSTNNGDAGVKVITNEATGATASLGWDVTTPTIVNPEDEVFYLAMLPQYNSQDICGFKMGWINVGEARKAAPSANRQSIRDWATFDLGIIGVNDIQVTNNGWSNILSIDATPTGSSTGYAYFSKNKSFPYLSYNQFNWVLKKSEFPTRTSTEPYYVVVDLHPECQSVTLCTVNLQPNITAKLGQIQKGSLPLTVAKEMGVPEYDAVNYAGATYVTNVNYASGSATITAAGNTADWQNAGFTRTYTLKANGEEFAEYTGDANTINLEYMPYTASATGLEVRAKYTDNLTGITFHSRVRRTDMTGAGMTTVAPTVPTLIAQYVEETKPSDSERHFGIFVSNFDAYVSDAAHNNYADVTINGGYQWEFVHENSDIIKFYNENYSDQLEKLNTWNWGWAPAKDYTAYVSSKDWSWRLANEQEMTPIYFPDVVTCADEYGTDKYGNPIRLAPNLPTIEISGTAHAVYPFLYNPDAQPTIGGASSAPRKAISANTDFTGFKVSHAKVPTTFTIVAKAEDVVSAVEMVSADDEAAEAEFYTISGIRVMGDPAPGIYVKKQGSKVTKVVIK